ncbi:MAG: tRNA (adenosine(37)-N6)-threonylcarbamoyltransferase complex dimerization subunit type 1 TsaB [Alphaproteobacteria bacterium]
METPSICLVIDCVSGGCGLGLFKAQAGSIDAIAQQCLTMQRGQAEIIIPTIKALMDHAQCEFSSIDFIVVNVGPGSYTGIRVGLAAAHGLSLAAGAKIIGVSAVDALLHQDQTALCALEAGREDVILATAETPPEIVELDAIPDWVASAIKNQQPIKLVGNALDRVQKIASIYPMGMFEFGDAAPAALYDFADLGFEAYKKAQASGIFPPITPLYLRPASITKPTKA